MKLPLFSLGLALQVYGHLQCLKKSDCSCEMTDGSGTVALTSLPKVRYCRPSPDPDCFIYDPCQPFTMGDNSDSSCQTRFGSVLCEMTQDEITRSYTSLGKLSTVLFNVSNDVTRQVTVTYVPPVESVFGDTISHIRLNCADSTASSANTTFQGSLVSRPPYKTYEFSLTSPDLCPKQKPCDICAKKLMIAVPVTAVGTVMVIMLLSCIIVRCKDRSKGND